MISGDTMSNVRPLFLSLAFVTLACSQGRSGDSPDASTPATAPLLDARSVRDAIVARPAFARLARAKTLHADGAGFEVTTSTVHASLPSRASSAVRVGAGEAWLELLAQDVEEREAEPVDGTLVFRDAARATDLVLAALDEGYEEVRVLRDPTAPSVFRWKAHGAPGTSLRVREGIAELVDEHGKVLLAAARPFAVDARGVRRELDTSFDGSTLVARLDVRGLAHPIVVDPLWSTIAPFIVSNRINYTVTKLASGKVLVGAGQPSGSGPISSAEVYDPATNTWASAGNMAYPRIGGFSALITAGASAGKVFVAGGSIPGSEVYDPATGTAVGGPAPGVTIASMAGAGSRVLVFNGTSAITWNSATNAWEAPLNSAAARYTGWTLTSLPDGRVVIIAGHVSGSPSSGSAVDIYRPGTNDFVAGASMTFAAEGHTSTLLATGTSILSAGGTSAGVKGSAVVGVGAVYNVSANTWSAPITLINPRSGHGAALLPNGKVVLAGGGVYGVELFDPATSAFQIGGNAPATDMGTTTAGISTGGLFFPSRQLYAPGALGTKCTVGYECMSSNCVQGTCCSSASCTGGARCDTATKAGTCTKPNGIACGAGAECESGICVDGVCCNSTCGSQCQACDVPGKAGTCSPVYGAPHGARTACAGTGGTDVCQRQICNGSDVAACHFAPAYTVVCGANTCASGMETHTGTCDGAGKCSDVPRVCGVYTCDASSCRTSCTSSTQCIAGFYCDTTKSACVPLVGLGNKCSSTLPCNAGMFCTDGVCCGVADCGAGSTCGAPGKEGTCAGKQGSACKVDAECGTSSCVDGVCCDTACSGQCEACDVAGAVGTCTPVTGKPHGARTACPTDASNECANALCDGSDRARCAALPGSEKECRAQGCKGGLLTNNALCDGKGNCPAKTTASCGGYRCDEVANTCKTGCTSAADCAAGWSCESGACKKNTSFCSLDGLSIVDNAGTETPCKPYRCKDAKCQSSCETTDDCSGGTLCATDTKTCVQPVSPTTVSDEGGGCATTSKRSSGAPLALFVLAALGLSRRRSAASRGA